MDLETECAVKTCPGLGGHSKCEHALKPHTARVTKVAVVGYDFEHVFNSADEYVQWLTRRQQDDDFTGQNFKFDLLHIGFQNPSTWKHDTQVMAHVYTEKVSEDWLEAYEAKRQVLVKERGIPYRKAGGLSLKTLAPYFLKVDPFWETADYDNDEYALTDARYTWLLTVYFALHMNDVEWEFYTQKELQWAKMLYNVERRGIICDKKRLLAMRSRLEREIFELEQEIDALWKPAHDAWHALKLAECEAKYAAMKNRKVAERNRLKALEKVPRRIEYSSPAQMAWLFRDYFRLNIENFEGEESTGRAVLERLADEGRKDIATYLKWRKKEKILTAFIPTYEEWLQHAPAIYPSFSITGTKTGRLSSSTPNFQQVSGELKQLFVPRPGFKFVSYDLAAIEAKLIAWLSDDPVLFEVIDKGWSLHDLNVKVFFNVDTPIEQVKEKHPQERKVTKNTGFALFYNAGPNRIKETFQAGGFIFSRAECERLYDNFSKTYKVARDYCKAITRKFEHGETLLNAVGRPVKLQRWENIYMQGFNRLVQSAASDINLDVAYKALERAKAAGIECYLLLLIHDALTFEVEASRAEEFEGIIKTIYDEYKLTTIHGPIRITGEGGVSDEWE